MDLGNIIGIVAVLLLLVGAFIYYYNNLKKQETELTFSSEYSVEALLRKVVDTFNSTLKTNLQEQNLSKLDFEKEKRNLKRLSDNLRASAYGDSNAKEYIKSCIKDILMDPRGCNVSPETVDEVIPFEEPELLTTKDKTDILFYLYYKKYRGAGFKKFMIKHGFQKPRRISREEEEDGSLMRYEVTEDDLNDAFAEDYSVGMLTYDDKLAIICQRIFEKYKGFGAVDMLTDFSIDEIDCGNNGIMEGAYQLKDDAGDGIPYTYKSIFVVFSGLNIKLSFMSFEDSDELIRVCKNIYKFSTNHVLSRRMGYVIGTMKDGSRIAVSRPPTGSSWGFWLRKFDGSRAATPEQLLKYNGVPEEGADKVLTLTRWIMKTCRTMMVTGGMGCGKTTWLRSIIRYIPSYKNIRVYEISPELNLQFTYPNRNVFNFSETETTSTEALYVFGKKTNAQISIIGESASAEAGVVFIESATVGSEMGLGTHHAKTAEDLVIALRDNLTMAGGYNNEKVAEAVVVKCLNFNTHMAREKDHRYIERITEIIPIRDVRYPADKREDHQFTENDTKEFYRRMTDYKTFECKNIIEYRNGRYEVVNRLSDDMYRMMLNYLPDEDVEEFKKDMDWLFKEIQ